MKILLNRTSKSGVTLVDVVMSIGVLGVMASGIFGCFRYGFFTLQLVRENQRATQVILEKVETIRLYSWDQIRTNGFVPATFTDAYDPTATANSQGVVYSGTVTIGSVAGTSSYSSNLRQLTVTLSWTTRGIPHQRSITTYIAKDGIQNYVY